MPTCANCNTKWNWKQILKKMFTFTPAMTCPYCGQKQYQTQKSKAKIGYLNSIVLVLLLIQIFIEIPRVVLVSSLPILAVIIMLVYPFLVELSSKEEFVTLSKDK